MCTKHCSMVRSRLSGNVDGLVSPVLQLRVLSNTFTRATTLPQQHQLPVQVSLSILGLGLGDGAIFFGRQVGALATQTRRDVRKTYHAML